jgi:hypothetical protein
MPHLENDQIVETPTEARAGETGHNVRNVLAVSTIGLAVIFVGIYFYFFA